MLIENHSTWLTYGPESAEANRNPMSNAVTLWKLRKLSQVVPKNRRIINMLQAYGSMFDAAEYVLCCAFVEHAEGFDSSSYERIEGVPRFPVDFEEMIRHGAA